MRDTFHSISSTVTDMRKASSKRKVERDVVLEGSRKSPMVNFQATRMVLDAESGKISMANGEKSNGRLVKIAKQPFAQGGLRNVYRMCEIHVDGMKNLVCKESRHEVPYQERLKFHIETSSCQAQAQTFADQFNTVVAASAALRGRVAQIKVLRAEVYRLADQQSPGAFRYLAVEDHIQGQYQKWNNNAGFTHPAALSPPCQVAQAFRYVSCDSCLLISWFINYFCFSYSYISYFLAATSRTSIASRRKWWWTFKVAIIRTPIRSFIPKIRSLEERTVESLGSKPSLVRTSATSSVTAFAWRIILLVYCNAPTLNNTCADVAVIDCAIRLRATDLSKYTIFNFLSVTDAHQTISGPYLVAVEGSQCPLLVLRGAFSSLYRMIDSVVSKWSWLAVHESQISSKDTRHTT